MSRNIPIKMLKSALKKSPFEYLISHVFLVFLFGFLSAGLLNIIDGSKKQANLPENVRESAGFRSMRISPQNRKLLEGIAEQLGVEESELMAAALITYDFDLAAVELEKGIAEELIDSLGYIKKHQENELTDLVDGIKSIWQDVKYFPVPTMLNVDAATVSFENSWMFERTFGGSRGHEGTDIMAAINKRGIYPIVSMTDGVVEKIGWLTKGGYRIGIRSPSGGYFYYAHMYNYAKEFKVGDTINAGEILGFMGDSGYGDEGTVGKFDVHLHMGIYIKTANSQELSVNSYWVLRSLEEKRLQYR